MNKLASLFVLLLITSLGLFIRLSPLLEEAETRRNGFGPYADPELYHILAWNMIEGNGFVYSPDVPPINRKTENLEGKPVIFRAPGYPLFLSLAYLAAPVSIAGADTEDWVLIFHHLRIIQCILDVSLCIAIFIIISLATGKSGLPGLCGAFLYAVSPFPVFFAHIMLTETLAAFLLCWAFVLFFSGLRTQIFAWTGLAGLLAALAALTRPEYILLIPLLGVSVLLFKHMHMRFRLYHGLVFIAMAGVLLGIWTYRNSQHIGSPVMTAKGGFGEMLHRGTFEGNHPWQGWGRAPDSITSDEERNELKRMYAGFIQYQMTGTAEILEFDRYFMKKALERIREHPVRIARSWLNNLPRLWYQNYIQMFRDREPPGWIILIYFVFAAAGLVRARAFSRPYLYTLVLPLVYVTLIFLPLHIESRYCIPVLPFLITLAGTGCNEVFFSPNRLNGVHPPEVSGNETPASYTNLPHAGSRVHLLF